MLQSVKSQKTVASLIVDNNSNTTAAAAAIKKTSSRPAVEEQEVFPDKDDNGELSEEARLANLNKLAKKKRKKKHTPHSFLSYFSTLISVPAPFKAKSPKVDKAPKKGKSKTTWDPFVFDSKGPSGEEARLLDRTQKDANGNPDDGENNDQFLQQFVPDRSVVGTSASNDSITKIKRKSAYWNLSIYLLDIQLLDEESDNDEEEISELASGQKQGGSGFWNSFSSLVGSKPLTLEAIEPVISKMRDHLIGKNVAADVATKLCDSVAAKLEGKVLGECLLFFNRSQELFELRAVLETAFVFFRHISLSLELHAYCNNTTRTTSAYYNFRLSRKC